MPTVTDICRYPVKGLSAEHLDRVSLAAGEGLPLDRAFALAHGTTQFDRDAPAWLSKTNFLMLMENERLAALHTAYDEKTGVLSILHDGRRVARGKVTEAAGRSAIERFFEAYMGAESRGRPKLVHAPGHMFSDTALKVLSLINLASLRELERALGRPLHPLRFRANVYVDGWEPWAEFDWLGREALVGSAGLRVGDRIPRCAATNVNPETAERDADVPRALRQSFGHPYMGVYAEVTRGGEIALGDGVEIG